MSVAERRATRTVAVLFVVAAASAVGAAVVFTRGGQTQRQGVLLGVAFVTLGAGLVVWGKRLLPYGVERAAREPLPSEPDQRAALDAEIDSTEAVLTRRHLLTRTLTGALAAIGAALLFPIRSLGPRPGRALLVTPWRDGVRLVTDDGQPVAVADVPVDGLVTVFPDGAPGSADGQAVLIRVDPGSIRPRPGRDDWSPQGFIAYSKLCTHAGCPVGLYEAKSHQLLCPCHQSTFDALDGARPVFGPAAASLPQLPLRIEGDQLVAGGDFSEPVGPAFWRHT